MIDTQTAKDSEGKGHRRAKVPLCPGCHQQQEKLDEETYGKWQPQKHTFDSRNKEERPTADAKTHNARISAEVSKDMKSGNYGNYESGDERDLDERDIAPPGPAPEAHGALREETVVPTEIGILMLGVPFVDFVGYRFST